MVRSFEDRPIPKDVLERVVANALRAPSAGFSQGWGFLVLDERQQLDRFWRVTEAFQQGPGARWPDVFNAPAIVVCLSNKKAYLDRYAEPDKGWTDRDEKRWPVPFWDIDTGMAALLALLTAVDAGLGALFFGIFKQREFKEAFGIPDEYSAIGAIALGYAKPRDRKSPSLKRGHRPESDVVHRGRW